MCMQLRCGREGEERRDGDQEGWGWVCVGVPDVLRASVSPYKARTIACCPPQIHHASRDNTPIATKTPVLPLSL